MSRNHERITFATIWPIIAPWRLPLIIALLSILAGGGLAILPPLILRRLIDNNLAQSRMDGIFELALGYLGVTLMVHFTSFLTAYSTSIAAHGALRRLRVRLFDHLQKLPVSYYDQTPIGDTISRCTSDMETIDSLFSSGVISLLAESVRIVFTLGAMIALSFPLSLAVIFTLPLLIVFTRRFQFLMRSAQRELRFAIGILNSRLQENLTRIEVIKAFNWSFQVVQRFRKVLSETLKTQNRSIAYGAVYDPFLKIFQAVLVAVFLIAGTSPDFGILSVSIGTLTAFILFFDQFFGPLIRIGNEWQIVQGALAGLERIFQILVLPTEETEFGNIRSIYETPCKDGILVEMERITFGYVDKQPILSNVSLQAVEGSHIAVVGRTGAGKSTLFHLLGGLYRPWEGYVCLEGKDPCRLSAIERRRILGVVPQAGWMFTGSVSDNLTLWDNHISREAVEKACRISGADRFITRLPDGYETLISDTSGGKGIRLSAGERQILTLSRALIGDPAILLFDEATAAVDGVTEAAFKQALRIQLEERHGVVITIAHRISTAMAANRIIVIDEGKIVEEGTPDFLLKNDGQFAALWALATAGWDWCEKKEI